MAIVNMQISISLKWGYSLCPSLILLNPRYLRVSTSAPIDLSTPHLFAQTVKIDMWLQVPRSEEKNREEESQSQKVCERAVRVWVNEGGKAEDRKEWRRKALSRSTVQAEAGCLLAQTRLPYAILFPSFSFDREWFSLPLPFSGTIPTTTAITNKRLWQRLAAM